MAKSSYGPGEAVGIGGVAAADCGLRPADWIEDLAWPGNAKERKKRLFMAKIE